jgi:hypothetical protein
MVDWYVETAAFFPFPNPKAIIPSYNCTQLLKGTVHAARCTWLKVASIDRSLLKGDALRFSADFAHPLSCERPFKCPRHLIQDLGYDNPISDYCSYLCWQPIFNPILIIPILLIIIWSAVSKAV